MGIINVVKMLKKVHPQDIIIIEIGTFYYIYGKDAYIISYLFDYNLKKIEDTYTCAFPKKSLNKVIALLENKKINYIIANKQNNYNVEFIDNNNNLNKYEEFFEKSKKYINNRNRICSINKYLSNSINKENINELLFEIEKIINKNSNKI